MKAFLLAAAVLFATATVVSAAPLKLTDQQLDQTVAGRSTSIINGTNNGNGNGNNNSGSGNGNFDGNLNGATIIVIVKTGRG